MSNEVRFFAMTADDVERARAFYEAVFGWRFEDWGPPDFYLIQGAGMPCALQKRREKLANGAQSIEITVAVDDVDETARKVIAAGGAIHLQKTHIDGVGTLIRFSDSEGNDIGAMKYDREQAT